jgi:hypothetical protein
MKATVIALLCFTSLLLFSACKSDPDKKKYSPERIKYLPGNSSEDSENKETTASYSETLEMNGISFNIVATGNELTVTPSGLEASNSALTTELTGTITGTELGDLNADGWPEVAVFTQSTDESKKGNAHVFSVLNGKSLSMVYLPPMEDNKDLTSGYVGGDEFAIVENNLIRRFILTDGSSRQLQYKMQEGENMRSLYVDKIVEY